MFATSVAKVLGRKVVVDAINSPLNGVEKGATKTVNDVVEIVTS